MSTEIDVISDLRRVTRVTSYEGDDLGEIHLVYADRGSNQVTFASVAVPNKLLGHLIRVIPLAGTTIRGNELVVPFGISIVRESPEVGSDVGLSPLEERAVLEYYSQFIPRRDSDDSTARHDDGGGDDELD